MKNLKRLTILTLIIFPFLLFSCHPKHQDPTPSTSSGPVQPVVVSSGIVAGNYTLGSSTYYTAGTTQCTYKANSHDFYILTATDNAGASFCEFWFSSKPALGTYPIISYVTGYLGGFGSNAGVAATAGSSSSIYYSQNYATAMTLDVSLNGTDLVVSVSGLSLVNSSVSTDTKNFAATLTFP